MQIHASIIIRFLHNINITPRCNYVNNSDLTRECNSDNLLDKHFNEEDRMLDQVQLLRELQAKADRLGVDQGTLVELGAAAVVRSSDEKVREVIGRIRCVPVRA